MTILSHMAPDISPTQVKCHICLMSNKIDDVKSGTRTWFQKVSYGSGGMNVLTPGLY